jgi:F0F1-type ATP synthase assembly protein I
MPKPDLTTERLYVAILIGVGGGILMGRFFGNYIAWIVVFTAITIAIETTTRVRKEGKEAEAQQENQQKMAINRLKPPEQSKLKPPKPPKPL